MLTFENDYSYGCHPKVLQKLVDTNMEALIGYGFDTYSEAASEKIRKACELPDADVYFLTGGTQANQIIIDALLPSWAGVAAARTGHIDCHEAGAVEFTGHKVLDLPAHDGKIDAEELAAYMENLRVNNGYAQMVVPAVVYISYPTEYGTLYTLSELQALRLVCDRFDLKLFCDGARLGYGLASPECDLTLPQLAALCDAFYIGGTKVGALCGEAAVFHRSCSPAHFYATVKQHGAMLAKGRLCSVQFDALFTDGLYFELGRHAMKMAALLQECLLRHGLRLEPHSPTNQQFAVLTPDQYAKISEQARICYWEATPDGNCIARFCTSWATTEDEIRELDRILDTI